MTALAEVLSYLLNRGAIREGVPPSRLARMLYLADWRAAILELPPVSPVRWTLGPFGPKSDEISEALRNNPDKFDFVEVGMEQAPKKLVLPKTTEIIPPLSDVDKQILDFVIDKTRQLGSGQLLRLVFSTYPVLKGAQGGDLDLQQLADEYRDETSLEPEQLRVGVAGTKS